MVGSGKTKTCIVSGKLGHAVGSELLINLTSYSMCCVAFTVLVKQLDIVDENCTDGLSGGSKLLFNGIEGIYRQIGVKEEFDVKFRSRHSPLHTNIESTSLIESPLTKILIVLGRISTDI